MKVGAQGRLGASGHHLMKAPKSAASMTLLKEMLELLGLIFSMSKSPKTPGTRRRNVNKGCKYANHLPMNLVYTHRARICD